MEKCHARQLQTLFIQELCPTQFQKNTRWLSVYSTMRSLRVKEQSVWGKVAGHLQQRPPGAEQCSAERSAARGGDLRTVQGSMCRPHKPGSEYIAQPPRDMGVPPWQVVQAPVWAPPYKKRLHLNTKNLSRRCGKTSPTRTGAQLPELRNISTKSLKI